MCSLTPLKVVSEWRRYVRIVAQAASRVVPNAELYLTGGVAEGRLTILSDVDILVVLPEKPGFDQAIDIRVRLLEEAERLGLPLYAPIEIHVIGEEELSRYAKKGKLVKLSKSGAEGYLSGRAP